MCRTYDDNSGGVGVGRSVQRRAEPLLSLVLHLYHVHTVPLSVVAWRRTQSHTRNRDIRSFTTTRYILTYLQGGIKRRGDTETLFVKKASLFSCRLLFYSTIHGTVCLTGLFLTRSKQDQINSGTILSVSYTHLTLPTILRV